MLMAAPGIPRYSSACFIVDAKKSWKCLPQRPYVSKTKEKKGSLDISLLKKTSQELFDISPIAAYSLIQKSSREIAPGVDNLRYEHLKQLAGRNSSPAEMEFVRIIAEVLTRFANADIPPQVALYYASPQLIPLVRRSQPGKVRPIVLGPVLIALASRHVLLSDSIKQRVQQMSKLQLGVGVPNGIEQVIHDDDDDYIYSFYRTSSHIITT